MEWLVTLYKEHLQVLQHRARQVLSRHQFDAMLIHSGELLASFLDDYHYPFKVNPHFKHWLPVTRVPDCWLWIDGVNKPKLWFYSPVDYWHVVEPLVESYWTSEVDVMPFHKSGEIAKLLPAQRANSVYIGPALTRAMELGFTREQLNPKGIIDYLHFYRAYKTDYELVCMREAQKRAILGHDAAKEAFYSGLSEFDINITYLNATGQRDHNLPYDNIVALNHHAAVLHYTKFDYDAPVQSYSFLLDAGAEYNGYAADITRTYAASPESEFAALIAEMNAEQLALIDTLKTGVSYTEYHLQMQQRIAHILLKFGLIKGLSEEALIAENITATFMPHGIGHPLGLQVHDVAGFMQDDKGSHLDAPDHYPWLRCTRILKPGMVMTIEPGIYFIDSLLAPWRESCLSQHFNWSQIDGFKPYGGVRIEDNVIFHDNRVENMTRDLNLN